MRMYDIISKKRDGYELTNEELQYFVNGVTSGDIPDYEITALLMAIYLRGMSDGECAVLTDLMAHSGDMVDLSAFADLSADKHSTGGVGDKTTLIVAPIAASLGLKVAKMSGRGLGHTGGTVDKLESIPGYKTSMSAEEFLSQVQKIGVAVVGQSGNLAPADKKLYALRDVTATVSSIPLIASSIMSKKLAAGSKNIVLDVKVGAGAFMKSFADAERLAKAMVDIGKSCGRNVSAILTSMDAPLGYAVGNSVEVIEAISVLRGEHCEPLREISLTLASEMYSLSSGVTFKNAYSLAENAVDSGMALEKMKEWIASQGGDVSYINDPLCFPTAKYTQSVLAPKDGYVTKIDAELIGHGSMSLGAGREKKDDVIDLSAGIMLSVTVGDKVSAGDVLCTLYTSDEKKLSDAEQRVLDAFVFSVTPPTLTPPILKIIK